MNETPETENQAAVRAMLTRIAGEKQRSYEHGYSDGQAWGLVNATRTDLHTARQLKMYSGRQMLTDGTLEFGDPLEDEAMFEASYPDGVPSKDIPGLPADTAVYGYAEHCGARFSTVYDHLKPHLGPGEQGNVYAYAEGWRDALSDLYGTLLDAEKHALTQEVP